MLTLAFLQNPYCNLFIEPSYRKALIDIFCRLLRGNCRSVEFVQGHVVEGMGASLIRFCPLWLVPLLVWMIDHLLTEVITLRQLLPGFHCSFGIRAYNFISPAEGS